MGLSAVAGAVTFTGETAPRPASGFAGGRVSLLDRPRGVADVLPDAVEAVASSNPAFGDSQTARLASTNGAVRIYVARGIDDQICLVVVDRRPGGSTAIDCAASSLLSGGGLVVSMSNPVGGRDIVGVVPDGAREASASGLAVPVRNNVFRLSSNAASTVDIRSSVGVKTVDIGLLEPAN